MHFLKDILIFSVYFQYIFQKELNYSNDDKEIS
jgi:hypothetical protein